MIIIIWTCCIIRIIVRNQEKRLCIYYIFSAIIALLNMCSAKRITSHRTTGIKTRLSGIVYTYYRQLNVEERSTLAALRRWVWGSGQSPDTLDGAAAPYDGWYEPASHDRGAYSAVGGARPQIRGDHLVIQLLPW